MARSQRGLSSQRVEPNEVSFLTTLLFVYAVVAQHVASGKRLATSLRGRAGDAIHMDELEKPGSGFATFSSYNFKNYQSKLLQRVSDYKKQRILLQELIRSGSLGAAKDSNTSRDCRWHA